MIDVSIIMINYKTPELCIDSVNSIYKLSKGFNYEIIIIDNASKDGSVEKIRAELGNKVVLVESKENLGTTKANNLGARKSSGNYLLFLNSDTLFINNYIGILKGYMDKHPDVGASVGNFYDINNNPTHSYRRHYGLRYLKEDTFIVRYIFRALNKRKNCEHFNYSNKPIDVFYICCAGMLVRREVFFDAGCYDEDIFMYGEEPIICKAIWDLGKKCISLPNAKMQHLEGASFTVDKNNLRFNKNREDRIFAGSKVYYEKCERDPQAVAKYAKYMATLYKNCSIIKWFSGSKAESRYFKDMSKYYEDKYNSLL